jgi:hypothetical protein
VREKETGKEINWRYEVVDRTIVQPCEYQSQVLYSQSHIPHDILLYNSDALGE